MRALLSQWCHRTLFHTFVLGLQSPVVGGLVQLESDELLGGIDTATDMRSGEAQD